MAIPMLADSLSCHCSDEILNSTGERSQCLMITRCKIGFCCLSSPYLTPPLRIFYLSPDDPQVGCAARALRYYLNSPAPLGKKKKKTFKKKKKAFSKTSAVWPRKSAIITPNKQSRWCPATFVLTHWFVHQFFIFFGKSPSLCL